jgi:hypothetical protein
VLPFPTAELAFAMRCGTHGDQVTALALYAMINMAMAVTWLVMFTNLRRHPRLLSEQVTAAFFRTERLRAAAGIVVPFVPVLIGVKWPQAALVVLVAMPVFYAVTAEGLRRPQSAAPADG